jgi:plastocyanin
MKRLVLPLAVALAAGALSSSAVAATPTLKGTVGPGFTITLTQGGKKVSALKAGKYKIVVSDKAAIHDFHLMGPGVNKATSISGMGTQTWTVTLKKGTYKYQCDPHASTLNGSFKVS